MDVEKYEAWMRAGSFEFVRPGKDGAYLEVEVPGGMVEKLKAETEGGYSTVVPCTSVIQNRDGSLVGIGQQELYVRRRSCKRLLANPNQQDRVAGENLISAARTLTRLGMRGVEDHDVLIQQERTARRCISPESHVVAWLHGALECGDVIVDDCRAAGLPDVVIEALTYDNPSPAAQQPPADVIIACESLTKF